jgi:hypothetical protein
MNRYAFNVLVGKLDGEISKPMLISTQFLENVNFTTINQALNKACQILWPNEIRYDSVLLIVSDQASTMIKAMSHAKILFPNLNHVTCLAHAFHRVCECIRQNNEFADKFISAMKKILLKSPLRRQLFKEICNIKLPPKPIVTRWGTWLEASFYYVDNFEKICEFVEKLKVCSKTKAIQNAKMLIKMEDVKNQLLSLHLYRFLPKKIEEIQSNSLSLSQQLDILKKVEEKLDGFALDKLKSCLAKNPDLLNFTSKNNSMDFLIKTSYAPLVSVAVERSFSTYKSILTDRRHNLLEANIEKLIMLNFNDFI